MRPPVDLSDIPTYQQDPEQHKFFHVDTESTSWHQMNFFLKMVSLEEYFGAVVPKSIDLSLCPEFHRIARECIRDIQAGDDPDYAISQLGATLYQAGIEAALRLPREHFANDIGVARH